MLSKRKKQGVIKDFRESDVDTGSATVQIGLLTKQIKELSEHLKKHPKDNHSRRGLLSMVGKRRKFLKYLSHKDKDKYTKITKKLELEA